MSDTREISRQWVVTGAALLFVALWSLAIIALSKGGPAGLTAPTEQLRA